MDRTCAREELKHASPVHGSSKKVRFASVAVDALRGKEIVARADAMRADGDEPGRVKSCTEWLEP
jgi:hypothetical protein